MDKEMVTLGSVVRVFDRASRAIVRVDEKRAATRKATRDKAFDRVATITRLMHDLARSLETSLGGSYEQIVETVNHRIEIRDAISLARYKELKMFLKKMKD